MDDYSDSNFTWENEYRKIKRELRELKPSMDSFIKNAE